VDDHPVVIEGLRKVLNTAGDLDVTGVAHDAPTAIDRAKLLQPDVILLDLGCLVPVGSKRRAGCASRRWHRRSSS
jgi:DNA-binding NarL/FixJ family response regulator